MVLYLAIKCRRPIKSFDSPCLIHMPPCPPRLVGPFFWLVFFSFFWGVVFLILLLYLAIFHQSNTNRFSPGILISTVSSVEALIFCLKPTGSFLP